MRNNFPEEFVVPLLLKMGKLMEDDVFNKIIWQVSGQLIYGEIFSGAQAGPFGFHGSEIHLMRF